MSFKSGCTRSLDKRLNSVFCFFKFGALERVFEFRTRSTYSKLKFILFFFKMSNLLEKVAYAADQIGLSFYGALGNDFGRVCRTFKPSNVIPYVTHLEINDATRILIPRLMKKYPTWTRLQYVKLIELDNLVFSWPVQHGLSKHVVIEDCSNVTVPHQLTTLQCVNSVYPDGKKFVTHPVQKLVWKEHYDGYSLTAIPDFENISVLELCFTRPQSIKLCLPTSCRRAIVQTNSDVILRGSGKLLQELVIQTNDDEVDLRLQMTQLTRLSFQNVSTITGMQLLKNIQHLTCDYRLLPTVWMYLCQLPQSLEVECEETSIDLSFLPPGLDTLQLRLVCLEDYTEILPLPHPVSKLNLVVSTRRVNATVVLQEIKADYVHVEFVSHSTDPILQVGDLRSCLLKFHRMTNLKQLTCLDLPSCAIFGQLEAMESINRHNWNVWKCHFDAYVDQLQESPQLVITNWKEQARANISHLKEQYEPLLPRMTQLMESYIALAEPVGEIYSFSLRGWTNVFSRSACNNKIRELYEDIEQFLEKPTELFLEEAEEDFKTIQSLLDTVELAKTETNHRLDTLNWQEQVDAYYTKILPNYWKIVHCSSRLSYVTFPKKLNFPEPQVLKTNLEIAFLHIAKFEETGPSLFLFQ